MIPAEELRAAATKLRADRPYGDLDEPLAALLELFANMYGANLITQPGSLQALDVARAINGTEGAR